VYWERPEVLVISVGDEISDDPLFDPVFSLSYVIIVHGISFVDEPLKDFKNKINCIANIPANFLMDIAFSFN
jgi:hypothetical protein